MGGCFSAPARIPRSYLASDDNAVNVNVGDDEDGRKASITAAEAFAPGGITSLAFCDDGDTLFAGFDSGFLAELDVGRGGVAAKRAAWDAHSGRTVTRVAAAGRSVWTASRDSTVRQWEVVVGTRGGSGGGGGSVLDPTCVGELRGHTLAVTALAVTADGASVATGGRDCTVRLWDAATRGETACVHSAQNVVTCAAFAGADGRLLAQGGEDLCVRLWDTRSRGSLRCVTEAGGYVYFPLALAVSGGGLIFATASKGFNGEGCEVREWDLRKEGTPLLVRTLKGHSHDATAVVFLEDGQLASASKDGTVRLWAADSSSALNIHASSTPASASASTQSLDVWASGGSNLVALAKIRPSENGFERLAVADAAGGVTLLTVKGDRLIE